MTGIIIQARQGSTRLPNKMNLSFYGGRTILELLVDQLKISFPNIPIILATTSNSNDDSIVRQGEQFEIEIFRGSEENVLKRFIDAASKFGITKIVRVCADNPFLNMSAVQNLIQELQSNDYDYISFRTNDGIPSIKTHYGFWAEGVKKSCLEKVQNKTSDKFFLEHVTNYIYSNPSKFNLRFLKIPSILEGRKIRLTIDTYQDFEIAQKIYEEVKKQKVTSIPEIISIIESNSTWINEMEKQIILNSK